jgi:hypothetical protein
MMVLLGTGAIFGLSLFIFMNWLAIKLMKIFLPGYLASLILFSGYYYALRLGVRQAAFPGQGKMSQRKTEFQYGQ